MSLPWIEKYRPNNLDDISGHTVKIQTLKNLIKKGELPHLLCYGSPGTGKTSTILACAIELYGEHVYKKYTLELNASDDRGIDVVRKQIKDFVRIASNKVKLVILDEADAMTHDAQNALRRVIEKNSRGSRFCLICNDISRIIPALQSRCTKMNFGTLSVDQIRPNVEMIVKSEGINISPEAVTRLISIDRDFRQIINTIQCLQSITSSDIAIKADDINEYLGIPTDIEIGRLLSVLTDHIKSFSDICKYFLDQFKDNHWSVNEFIHRITRKILLIDKIKESNKIEIMIRLSDIDYKVSNCNDFEIQLYSLVATFYKYS